VGVLLHLRDDELLVERAAVDADAHRLAAIARDAADRRELLVAPPARAHVAGVDAVLVERRRAAGMARQQEMAVVVEGADEGRRHARVQHALLDFGNRRGRLGHVHGHPDHLGSRFHELDALLCGGRRIRRVGHRHRLHDDRRAAADLNVADANADSSVEPDRGHVLDTGRSYHPSTAHPVDFRPFPRGITLALTPMEGASQMSVMNLVRPVALVLALAAPATAQSDQRTNGSTRATVNASDIQRLQDQVDDAGNEIARLRSRDQYTADRLQARLDDLRDETIYLRVKLRKEGTVTRSEYYDVSSQVQSVRNETRAADARLGNDTRQGNSTWSSDTPNYGSGGYGSGSGSGSGSGNWPAGTSGQTTSRRNEVPAGTELDVRLERELSSDTAKVEDRFTATTLADLYQGNNVLIPAGSTMRGVVSSVTKATRTERKGALTVAFDHITINGRSYPIHGIVTQALESEGIKGEIGKIGAGAGVGAIIGGIIGGAKGALIGVLIGGGGTIAATEGKDVTLQPGTVLRVRMEQPLLVR